MSGTDNNGNTNLPETTEGVRADLTKRGFRHLGTSPGGYETWENPETQTRVTIKPPTERGREVIVVQTKPRTNAGPNDKQNYPQRQDYWGNKLPTQSHTTDHFVTDSTP
jgi:hypothetical protein